MKTSLVFRRALACASLGALTVGACGSGDQRPTLEPSAGSSGLGGRSSFGGSSGDGPNALAGESEDAGHPAEEGGSGGAEDVAPAEPLAVYARQLEVDVGCSLTLPDAPLLIQNRGSLPLLIKSASADSGYQVHGTFPLQIAPRGSATLLVTPPAAKASAAVGEHSTGTLRFATNEPGSAMHEVALDSTLFGATAEFTDGDGVPISGPLTLSHVGAAVCPDTVKYRVRNTGNLTFTLFGPTFAAHLAGTSTEASGADIAPGDELELQVGPASAPGSVCSASGSLLFTASGAFCGNVPTLSVAWSVPAGASETSCACTAVY